MRSSVVTSPAILVSPTTPMTVSHRMFLPGVMRSSGFSGLNMRRPMDRRQARTSRASRSSTMTTGADASVSLSLNVRPLLSGIPSVSI